MSGKVTEKMTKKRLAEEVLHISEKTAREYSKNTDALARIRQTLQDDSLMDQFEKLIMEKEKNKKSGISSSLYRELAKYDQESIKRIIGWCLDKPEKAGDTLRNLLMDASIRITVTLPSYVNDFYIREAKECGISKTKFIERLLYAWAESQINQK